MAKAKDTATAATPMSKSDDDWKVQSALDTLIRAEEIESDSALMAKVRKLAKSKMDDMSEIAGEPDEKVERAVKAGRINERQAEKLRDRASA